MQKDSQKLQGGRGTYQIDRTSVVCRDSYGNAYYLGLEDKGGQQRIICIKEYHRSFSNKDAELEWSIIEKLQKDKTFFKDRMVVKGQPYLVLSHFDSSLAGLIANGKETRISPFFSQVSREIGRCNKIFVEGWEFSLDPSCIVVKKEKGFTNIEIVNFVANRAGKKRNHHYEEPVALRSERQQEDDFSKRNVWEFGCILYELLSGGEKLFQREQLTWKDVFPRQIQRYVRRRVQTLRHYLSISQSKYEDELRIAEESLGCDQSRRPDLQNLETQSEKSVKPLNSKEDVRASEIQIICSSLFEAKRCNYLYGCINDTFLLCDRMQPVEKVPIYIALKFIVYFYLQTYSRAKAKAQQVKSVGQCNLLKFFCELQQQKYRFFQEGAFTKGIESAINNVKKGSPQLDKMLRQFSEWKEYEVLTPHKVFFKFCCRYKSVLCENKKVGLGLYRLMHLTRNYDELSQLHMKNDSLSYRQVELILQESIIDWKQQTQLTETAELEQKWTKVIESFYPQGQREE